MSVDGLGNPLRSTFTPGQKHDITQAAALLTGYQSEYVVADNGSTTRRATERPSMVAEARISGLWCQGRPEAPRRGNSECCVADGVCTPPWSLVQRQPFPDSGSGSSSNGSSCNRVLWRPSCTR